MRRTYRVPFSRAGLAGLMAALVLLCLPGTSIAGGASDTTPALAAGSGLLQYGAGYGKAEGAPPVRVVQRTLRRLGWQPGPVDGLYGPRTRGRGHPLPSRRASRGRRNRRPADAASADARAERAAPAGSRLCTARRVTAGAHTPGRIAAARASARPGGRPVRATDAGGGRTPPAVRRCARERCGHRPARGSCWPAPASSRSSRATPPEEPEPDQAEQRPTAATARPSAARRRNRDARGRRHGRTRGSR